MGKYSTTHLWVQTLPDFCRDQFSFVMLSPAFCNERQPININKINEIIFKAKTTNQAVGD
jgi:hypothetical protein